MKVAKPSLVAMPLEACEENAAVLLAQSPLPDELDTDDDFDALLTLGLERDQAQQVAPIY